MNKILSELTIEIVQKCANSCLFCSSLSGRSAANIIASDNVIDVGLQAIKLGLQNISISGGEPLLHPDIESIVSELVSMGLEVSIYTTGIVFEPNGSNQAFREWSNFDKTAVRLIFGLQSTCGAVHDAITRNQGSFLLTKEAMLSAQSKGFSTEVHLVPNKLNLSSIVSSVEDLLAWGIERISFLRLVTQGYARNYKSKLLLDENETKELKGIFSKLTDQYSNNKKIRLGIPFSGIINSPKVCGAGESKLIIRHDGKALPCEAFKDDEFNEYVLGDIREHSVENILKTSSSNGNLINLKSLITPIETCPAQLLYS